ncbi:hypothetical protein D3261_10205 [Halococcus sp. IIIV-5B]|nr:hypothetical protein D3261_10205 [Halococcus sp. IIIV-5B]
MCRPRGRGSRGRIEFVRSPRNAERLARLVFRASRSLAPLVHARHRRFAPLTTCFTLAPLA